MSKNSSLDNLVMEKAEEISQKRFGIPFDDLDSHPAMRVYMDAEQEVDDILASRAERLINTHREKVRLIGG